MGVLSCNPTYSTTQIFFSHVTSLDVAEEIQSFLGYGKELDGADSEKRDEFRTPTESELNMSRRLKYDKESGSEEIVPCCTYFCWGSYIACCTDDVNTLKLLGVYVEKSRDKMDFEHSRLYVTRVKATGIQSAEFTGTSLSSHHILSSPLHSSVSHSLAISQMNQPNSGKNNLYLDLFFCKWSTRTKVLNNNGPDADFFYGDKLVIDAASKTIASQGFKVVAYDKNKVRNDIFIGEGAVTINSLLEVGFDQAKSFTFPLGDKNGKLTGSVTVDLILRKRADL